MKTLLLERTVGQLVADKPARSRVFEHWGIDYCCNGNKPLSEACAAKKVDPSAVVHDLEASDATVPETGIDWTKEPLAALCNHIEQVHHGYLRSALPRLSLLTEKVANSHGTDDPRALELRDTFKAFRSEMESHTAKEEQVLFPAIRSLEGAGEPDAFARAIAEPIKVMLAEHENAGAALEKMRSLTDGFTPGPAACNTQRAMLDALSELEADTHQHVHKENNILFPRAIEKSLALA